MPKLSEELRESRRDRILVAALRCFARKGYFPTTIDDIAAEAGVSKGSPYVYFESKEALFRALCERWECGLSDRIDAAVADLGDHGRDSSRATLEAVVRAVGAHVVDNAELCRVLIEAETQAAYLDALAEPVRAYQDDARRRLESLIEEGRAHGEWLPDADAEALARLIVATLQGLMTQWHLAPGSFSWEKVAPLLAGAWSPGGELPSGKTLADKRGRT